MGRFLALLLMAASGLAADLRVQESWVRYYPSPGNTAQALARLNLDPSGNVCVAGQTSNEIVVLKYDAAGNELWNARYAGAALRDSVVDAGGNIYVTATQSADATNNYILLIKYAPSGLEKWAARLRGESVGQIAIDANFDIYLVGHALNTNGYSDYQLAKYNFDGEQLWAVQTDYGTDDKATVVAVDGNRNVYVAGSAHAAKYDPQGQLLWSVYVPSYVWAAALDSAGNLHVAAHAGYGILTSKYDPAGTSSWHRSLAHHGFGFLLPHLRLDAAGNVHVLAGSADAQRLLLVQYNPDGQQVSVSACCGGQQLKAHALAVDPAGNAYIAVELSNDFSIAKFDPSGTRTWLAQHNRAGQDSARAIAVDNSGNVFAAGYAGSDLITIKYQQQEVPGSPAIINPPQDTQFAFGSPIVLSATASNASTYQWYLNGIAISGATNDTLFIPQHDYSWQQGLYSFGASSHVGETVSPAALVSFYFPAVVARQPRSRYAYAGENVFLAVTRGGEADTTQWFHNGNPLAGATNDLLALTSIQPAQAGEYHAVVWGPHTRATSEVARVSVFATNPLLSVWRQDFQSASNFSETAYGIASDDEDSIYVAGQRYVFAGYHSYWTAKYDQHGSRLWNTTSTLSGFHLRVGPGNTLAAYAAGHYPEGGFRRVNYDANGAIIATLEQHGTNFMEWPGVQVDGEGNIYVGGGDRAVVKYRSDGEQLWNIRAAELVERIAVDEVGNLYAVAYARRWPQPLIITKYDPAGNLLRNSSVPIPFSINRLQMRLDANGNLYVVAGSYGSLGYAHILKFNSSGELIWATRCYENARISTIAVDGENNLYLAGESYPWAFLTKFSPDGVQLWNATVSDGNTIYAMTALRDGSLALAGTRLQRWQQVLDSALPVILDNPQNQIIEPGAQAVLSVNADNAESLSYQWLRGGNPIPGATNHTFTTSSSGAYSVVVLNGFGFVISRTAEITIPLRLSIARIGAQLLISALAEPNVQYALLVADDLRANYWAPSQYQNGMIYFSVPLTDTRTRFFQVRRFGD